MLHGPSLTIKGKTFMTSPSKKVTLRYFAVLKDDTQKSEEIFVTEAENIRELFAEIQEKYAISLREELIKVAVNQEYRDFNAPIACGDEIVFIPPVAGG